MIQHQKSSQYQSRMRAESIITKANKDLFMLEPAIDVQCQAKTTSEVSPETKEV